MWALALDGRLASAVRLRRESFGAIAYVPERDDFFALDRRYAAIAHHAEHGKVTLRGVAAVRARRLASLGILETDPRTPQRPHHGMATVGGLAGIPDVGEPLLVNCLSTAYCPLRCLYCYADDVMTPHQDTEDWPALQRVAAMAEATPSMVAVITGGEPLYDTKRAAYLIRRLGPGKALVLDTSGAGDLTALLPLLREYSVHVRVSVDSADSTLNDSLRPIRRRYLPLGASAHGLAYGALALLRQHGIPHSVQTVVSARNADLTELLRLRDDLVARGTRHWILHVAVPAGKAAHRPWIQPHPEVVRPVLATLVARTMRGRVPIDIRVTGAHREPDAVLLIDPGGRLCLEDRDVGGKKAIADSPGPQLDRVLAQFRIHVNNRAHARRYLNGSFDPAPDAARGPAPWLRRLVAGVPGRPGSAALLPPTALLSHHADPE